MKKLIIYSLFALAALMGWSACSDDEIVGKDNVEVQLHLAVPANELVTRAPGDPGAYESFPTPQFIYAYIIVNKTTVKTGSKNGITWKREGDYYTSYTSDNTSEKPFTFSFESNENIENARIYVLASNEAIGFDPNQSLSTPEDVENLIFSATGDNGQPLNLRDVYSTPYNLLNADNEYYGTGTIFAPGQNGNTSDKTVIAFGTSKNKLTLYRVAAKVDFQWEAQDHTSYSTIKKIEVTNAPTQGYCFKPVGNVKGTSYTNEYTATVLSSDEVNEGNKWEGRAYSYMLQPQNYSLTYKVTTEQGSKTVTTSETGMNKSEIYSAWYMIRLNLK